MANRNLSHAKKEKSGMVITMRAGVKARSDQVRAVKRKAREYGLKPVAEIVKGTHGNVIVIYLKNGRKARCSSIDDGIFDKLNGVNKIARVSESLVSIDCNGPDDARHIELYPGVKVGYGLPCQPIVGPCSIDTHINEIVKELAGLGVKMMRACFVKPRSDPFKFRGFGEEGLRWFLEAAARYDIKAVFTEVLASHQIALVRRVQKEVGYAGTIVLWVGARNELNQDLLVELGLQHEFPVMIKNGMHDAGIGQWKNRAKFVLAGPMHWNRDGTLNEKLSKPKGNDKILLCERGTEKLGNGSGLFRFQPNHDWIYEIKQQAWTPIGVDPSHSAGTMHNDLVLKNLRSALEFDPDFVLLEGGHSDRLQILTDREQAVTIDRISGVLEMIKEHNKQRFSKK